MHMADALLTPAVGGVMWAASAATTVYCAKRVREEMDPGRVPLMGVAGAFVFAGQMLNFTIPATGSSGHIGGGLLLALLLGPHAAFLVIASILTVQALFFADGGVLALGANIFNLGFFPAFVAYPLVYKTIVGANPSRRRAVTGAVAAAVVGLQLGSLGVVLQTVFSGVSELPPGPFLALMQPIHLAIGIVEGLVTAAVVLFVLRAQPDILASTSPKDAAAGPGVKRVAVALAVTAVVVAVSAVGFASSRPDGLEWSIDKMAGTSEIDGASGALHDRAEALQERTALLPGYRFRNTTRAESLGTETSESSQGAGTGALGAGISVALVVLAGLALRRRSGRT